MISFLAALLLALPGKARAHELLIDNFAQSGVVAGPRTASAVWQAEAGELRSRRGTAWSRSPALRLFTRRSDFKNVSVSFSLLTRGLEAGAQALENAWDGVHLWLRYVSEDSHYYASINRRDGTVVIKKKAQGSFYTLSPYAAYAVPYNSWQSVRATVNDNPDGSVTLALYMGDAMLVSATDNGSVGGAPILDQGRVGLRADNAELDLAQFVVASFEARLPAIRRSSATVVGAQATLSWTTDIPSDSEVDYGPTPAYGASSAGGWGRDHFVAVGGLSADTVYHYRVRSRSGPNAVTNGPDAVFRTASTVDISSPTVALTSPAPGQPLNGVVGAAATASDDVGVVGVQFFLDGHPLGAPIAAPPYAMTFPTARFSDGQHTLSAVARDAAGNRGVATLTVAIGTSLTQPAGAAAAAASSPAEASAAAGVATPPAAASTSPAPGAPAASAATPRTSATAAAAGAVSVAAASPDGVRAPEKFLTPAVADGINDAAHFGPQAARVTIFDLRGHKIFEAARGASPIVWNGRNSIGRLAETGVYLAKIAKDDGRTVYQSLAIAK